MLKLIIHSLYSDRDIFLRELISNASDACDKLRFLALTEKDLYQNEPGEASLGIWIEIDEQQKTIRVRDNGIGMSHAEVIENIGTIARSGTREFMARMAQQKSGDNDAGDNAFIGQFGVGFYSSFLVAKEVTLLTRRAGAAPAEAVKWTSDGSGEYRVETIERAERGTEIILKLHAKQKEYLSAQRLRNIIGKYSDHISLPIYMRQPAQPGADDQQRQDPEPPPWEAVNHGSALWCRPKAKISADEYNQFYTALTYDPQPPAVTLHNRVEGKMEYISLFYIPSKAPFNLWDREQRHGIKLYVRRIFITEDAKQLMPNYLRFVRGLVDSTDLPLNVSREFLQQNQDLDKIRAASVKKILAELKKIADKQPDQYNSLWREYGRVLKEGVIEDFANQDAIAKLLRFASTHTDSLNANTANATASASTSASKSADGAAATPNQSVSLDDYLQRMPAKQKAIYYITADSYAAAKSSPHLEIFRENDIEVLLLFDPVDEWVVGQLNQYQEKSLQSIAKGDLDIAELTGEKSADNERDEQADKQKQNLQPLVDKIKAVLKEQVKDVRISNRLVDSPACLVADAHDLGGNMERILQATGQDAPNAKPILEINPQHAIVKQIDASGELADDWAIVLFEQAALAEGASLKDPSEYVKRVNRLLVNNA